MNFQKRFNQKYKINQDTFGVEPLPIVKKTLDYISSGEALDLGVGNGRNTLYLLSKSFEVTGVDSSQEGINILIEKAGNNPKLKTFCTDVLNFETKKQYDLVLAIGLLHFLNRDDAKNLIEKMKSWTKIGGYNAVGAKMTQNIIGDLPYIFRENELKEYYLEDSWEIKSYEEIETGRSKVSFLIAKKL